MDSYSDQSCEQANVSHLCALSCLECRKGHSCVDERVLLVYIWKSEVRQINHLRSPFSAKKTIILQNSQHFYQPKHQESLLQMSPHMFHAPRTTFMVHSLNQFSCDSALAMESEGMFCTVGYRCLVESSYYPQDKSPMSSRNGVKGISFSLFSRLLPFNRLEIVPEKNSLWESFVRYFLALLSLDARLSVLEVSGDSFCLLLWSIALKRFIAVHTIPVDLRSRLNVQNFSTSMTGVSNCVPCIVHMWGSLSSSKFPES